MSSTFCLDIGGVIFEIVVPPEVRLTPLLTRYDSFLSQAAVEWQVELLYAPNSTQTEPPWITHDGAVTHFQVMGHQGWIDLAARRACVTIASETATYSALVRTLSFVCMQELPRRQEGLLLHGAGIVIDGQGLVFFGASGQGKSTVARLAQGQGDVLTDETVIVRLTPAGPTLLSTPFWGLSTPVEQTQQNQRVEVPLHALYSLIHAPEFTLTPLSPARAVMELLTSEKVATERVSSASAWLAMAGQLVQQVPLYQLRFRPTIELWSFLTHHS